jgi:hypothetical protein
MKNKIYTNTTEGNGMGLSTERILEEYHRRGYKIVIINNEKIFDWGLK